MRRILEFDGIPDEDLPPYSPIDTPQYETGELQDNRRPIYIYRLRKANHKVQQWVSFYPSMNIIYQVKSHGSFRIFSKKPDMEMVSMSHNAERKTASIFFDDNGPLPWRPRARVSHQAPQGRVSKLSMESPNFSDWTVEIAGNVYVWGLETSPTCLVLRKGTQEIAIARFIYSSEGTLAKKNGAEVGELEIYQDGLSADINGIEKVIASVMVPIVQFKRMGRRYWNAEVDMHRH